VKWVMQLALAAWVASLAGCPVTPQSAGADVGTDSDGGPELGQPSPDVGNGWPDASTGGSDGGDAMCSADAVALWSAAHENPWLVTVIHGCVTGVSCAGGPPCDLASCLRDSAGLEGCVGCVEREAACISRECADDCGVGDTAGSCLACLCGRGCVGEFEGCTGMSVGVCHGYPDADCGFQPLSPALIMVVAG
jgi:hypothetical protein